jgi:hypothetical protein
LEYRNDKRKSGEQKYYMENFDGNPEGKSE